MFVNFIFNNIFVFVYVFAKQIQADPLSILATSRYIRPHFCIFICICETNPSRSTQYSGYITLYPATFLYLYMYLGNKSKQIHSVFWLRRAISGHIFVFLFVFAKQIQADPLSILATSRYIRPHFCICICIWETNPSRSTQYSGYIALYPATFLYLYLYLRNKSKQIHSVFWLPRAISGHTCCPPESLPESKSHQSSPEHLLP